MTLHKINHYPEQMTAGDVVTPANMLAFNEYETPEQAVRDIIRWFLDRDTVPVEPEHQHQWLPWLTLPNGSSWTQCTGCGEQFQYDH